VESNCFQELVLVEEAIGFVSGTGCLEITEIANTQYFHLLQHKGSTEST
jgi:hypothetical protein